jgi:hypothetical protein
VWLCAQVAPFVGGDTGSIRDLEHVLWNVRLTIIIQLTHWKLRGDGVWTVPIGSTTHEKGEVVFDRLLNHARRSSHFQA